MPVLTKINTNSIADDAVTGAKIPTGAVQASEIAAGGVSGADIGYLGDGSGNLSGTIANQQLHFGSAFTLTDDLTVNDNLTLGNVRDDGTGQSITGDGKTITGTGTLTMGGSLEGGEKDRPVNVAGGVATQVEMSDTRTSISTIETNIAQLAFYRAADHSSVKYNLTDQVIDTYQDTSGIDAGNSTNEIHDNTNKKWDGGTTSTTETFAGLGFRHLKIIVTLADFHDANAGIGVVNFDNGTGTAGDHQPLNVYDGKTTPPTVYNTTQRDKTTISAWDESNESSFYWWVTQGSLNQWCWVDFGETKTGVTKIFIGKSRTNGDVRGIHIDYSTTDTTTYSSIVWTAMPFEDATNAQMTYGTTSDGIAFSMNRHDSTTISLSAHGSNGNSGYSSIEGGTLWDQDVVTTTRNQLTLQSTSLATASSAPTKGDLVIQVEDILGTSTINTDIRGFVSRDGGTTFTQGTFVDEGTWGTNKRILAFHDLNIAGQPSGTDMRYKITTHNQTHLTKHVAIHAAALAWS